MQTQMGMMRDRGSVEPITPRKLIRSLDDVAVETQAGEHRGLRSIHLLDHEGSLLGTVILHQGNTDALQLLEQPPGGQLKIPELPGGVPGVCGDLRGVPEGHGTRVQDAGEGEVRGGTCRGTRGRSRRGMRRSCEIRHKAYVLILVLFYLILGFLYSI